MQRGPVITFAASPNKARERAARSLIPENALGGRKCSEISAIGCAHARQLTSVATHVAAPKLSHCYSMWNNPYPSGPTFNGGGGFGRRAGNNLGPALDRSTSTAACSTSASQERPRSTHHIPRKLRTRRLRRESATFFVSERGDGRLRPHDRARGGRRRPRAEAHP
jgi:hypothetical protein